MWRPRLTQGLPVTPVYSTLPLTSGGNCFSTSTQPLVWPFRAGVRTVLRKTIAGLWAAGFRDLWRENSAFLTATHRKLSPRRRAQTQLCVRIDVWTPFPLQLCYHTSVHCFRAAQLHDMTHQLTVRGLFLNPSSMYFTLKSGGFNIIDAILSCMTWHASENFCNSVGFISHIHLLKSPEKTFRKGRGPSQKIFKGDWTKLLSVYQSRPIKFFTASWAS